MEAHHDVDVALAKIKNKGRKRGDLMDETVFQCIFSFLKARKWMRK